jgi:hypothetical protein
MIEKNLIFITAYCPTKEQEDALGRCLDSVLKTGIHIALLSHTHVPIHIQEKCQYYFYDYLNDISDDYNYLSHQAFSFSDKKIQSRFFNKYFYGFSIYRMFSMASQIAINFGYHNIHHIEYDCELLDPSIITENIELLKEYDSVIYTDTGRKDGFLFGSLKSFKVNKLPNNFKNFNREYIEEEIKNSEYKYLEHFTKYMFINSGKAFFQPVPSDERFRKGINFYNRNLHYTIYYDPDDSTLNIFYNSTKGVEEEIVVIVNKDRVINIKIKPDHWHIKSLGIFNEINHIRIDNTDKIIYEKYFDDDFREIFKIKSYISNN